MNDIAKIRKDRNFAAKFKRLNDNSLRCSVEVMFMEQHITKNPSLLGCTEESLRDVLLEAAYMRLTLSPQQKLAYVIPWYNKKTRESIATYTPSYMGLVQMALRSKGVLSVQGGVVYKGDTFKEWSDNTGKHLSHTVRRASTEVTHAYCISCLASGVTQIEVMTMAEINACKEASARLNDGKVPFTWTGAFKEEMYKKCVIRRASKGWPRDEMIEQVIAKMDKYEPMSFDDSIPVVTEETVTEEEVAALRACLTRVPEQQHDSWLAKLAAALGQDCIEQLPRSELEIAKVRLVTRMNTIYPEPATC